jgi:protein associated with RNAse G/E
MAIGEVRVGPPDPHFAPGTPVTVRKLDYGSGRATLAWTGTLISCDLGQVIIRAVFAPRTDHRIVVDGVAFERGDIFTEYYPLGRWYNVFHIADPLGRVKGWYCNVTLPPVLEAEGIAFTDMALDLFVHPNGAATVLDEDEFAAASETLYRADDARAARYGLVELQRLADAGLLPAPRP